MRDPIPTLARLRLQRDLTFAELAAEIGAVDASTIYRLITNPGRRAQERTLFKIRQYLRRVASESEAA